MRYLIIACLVVGCSNQVSSPVYSVADENVPTPSYSITHTVSVPSQDQLVANAFYSLIRDQLFPRIIALGIEPLTLDCATGNVVLTGTQCTHVSNVEPKFILTYDIQYHVNHCQMGDWTFSGVVSDKGTWAENTVPVVELKSDALTINDQVCAVDINNNLSGNWCGRNL